MYTHCVYSLYMYTFIFMHYMRDNMGTYSLTSNSSVLLSMHMKVQIRIPQEVLGSSPPTMEAMRGTWDQRAKLGA